MSEGVVRVSLPKFGEVLRETQERKEVWAWDGVVPAKDVTLVAAFMKKGKTTLLTGFVNGLLRVGHYCGRPMMPGRRVLYLAPEEGDTLVRRFERLVFEAGDEQVLTVVPRGHAVWGELVSQYRMREWGKVVRGLKEAGYDTVVMDGLHTLLQMFEPQAKEDNEGVGRFMSQFVLPFGSEFTVVCSLHTKKAGGDPRVRVPPEEMIRGASAWMAHPGQILVMEHDRKSDTKTFHAFGRYEGTTAQGWVLRYDERRRDYVAVGQDEEADLEAMVGQREQARVQAMVVAAIRARGAAGATKKDVAAAVTAGRVKVDAALEALEATGILEKVQVKGPSGQVKAVWRVPDPGDGFDGDQT